MGKFSPYLTCSISLGIVWCCSLIALWQVITPTTMSASQLAVSHALSTRSNLLRLLSATSITTTKEMKRTIMREKNIPTLSSLLLREKSLATIITTMITIHMIITTTTTILKILKLRLVHVLMPLQESRTFTKITALSLCIQLMEMNAQSTASQ